MRERAAPNVEVIDLAPGLWIWRLEHPAWNEHCDALTERGGTLRVWMSPTHEERAIPDLRVMLDLPLERVIISHGAPLHTPEAFERALERPPWPASPLLKSVMDARA